MKKKTQGRWRPRAGPLTTRGSTMTGPELGAALEAIASGRVRRARTGTGRKGHVDASQPSNWMVAPAVPVASAIGPPQPAGPPKPRRTKCAIIGFASSSRDLAPFDDQTFEIWGLNNLWQQIPRWDVWFEMHLLEHVRGDIIRRDGRIQNGTEHYEWMCKRPANAEPIYMQKAHAEIPASVAFPREKINEYMGRFGVESDYLTSSISYMLVLAMYEGFKEIHLYGVDMLQEEEYYYQRTGLEYLIGLARGSGIAVYVPPQSALLKANYTYGYSEPVATKGSLHPLTKKIMELEDQVRDRHAKATEAAQTINGVFQTLGLLRKWIPPEKKETPDMVEVLKWADEVTTKMQPRQAGAIESMNKIEGLLQGTQTIKTWIEHIERGGA